MASRFPPTLRPDCWRTPWVRKELAYAEEGLSRFLRRVGRSALTRFVDCAIDAFTIATAPSICRRAGELVSQCLSALPFVLDVATPLGDSDYPEDSGR